MVDLRPLLHATESAWRKNLDEMHARSVYILGPNVTAFEQDFATAEALRLKTELEILSLIAQLKTFSST